MNARKIAAAVCAPLLLAACAAGSAAGQQGAAGTHASQGPQLKENPGPSGTPVGQAPVSLATVTGVFHRVGGPVQANGSTLVVPLHGQIRFLRAGHPVISVVVGKHGLFSAQLAPGTYRVTGITPDIVTVLDNGRQLDGRCQGPQALSVSAGHTSRITVTCDVP